MLNFPDSYIEEDYSRFGQDFANGGTLTNKRDRFATPYIFEGGNDSELGTEHILWWPDVDNTVIVRSEMRENSTIYRRSPT